ncbi:MAG: hypothetical protein QNJ30_01670 [Kiloniellales bacterium]|nr:hypothetical protein [Kiloniellales bacterium]
MVRPNAWFEPAINAMTAKGRTPHDIGAVWGWRDISPEWRGVWSGSGASLPLDYQEADLEKAILIRISAFVLIGLTDIQGVQTAHVILYITTTNT